MKICHTLFEPASHLILERLWLVQELRNIESWIEDLIKAMAQRAEIEIEVCMPGMILFLLRGTTFDSCFSLHRIYAPAARPAHSLVPLALLVCHSLYVRSRTPA